MQSQLVSVCDSVWPGHLCTCVQRCADLRSLWSGVKFAIKSARVFCRLATDPSQRKLIACHLFNFNRARARSVEMAFFVTCVHLRVHSWPPNASLQKTSTCDYDLLRLRLIRIQLKMFSFTWRERTCPKSNYFILDVKEFSYQYFLFFTFQDFQRKRIKYSYVVFV